MQIKQEHIAGMTMHHKQNMPAPRRIGRAAVAAGVAALLGACASAGPTASPFVDPARYDLYDCKQLADARKGVDARITELEGLMAKARTGVAGGLVSGVAYESDYVTARAQRDLIDSRLAADHCTGGPAPAAPAVATSKRRRGS